MTTHTALPAETGASVVAPAPAPRFERIRSQRLLNRLSSSGLIPWVARSRTVRAHSTMRVQTDCALSVARIRFLRRSCGQQYRSSQPSRSIRSSTPTMVGSFDPKPFGQLRLREFSLHGNPRQNFPLPKRDPLFRELRIERAAPSPGWSSAPSIRRFRQNHIGAFARTPRIISMLTILHHDAEMTSLQVQVPIRGIGFQPVVHCVG